MSLSSVASHNGHLKTILGLDVIYLGTRLLAWMNGVDLNGLLATLTSVITLMATAYVVASKIVHDGRLKRQAETWEQQRKQRLQEEADAKESLSKKIADLLAKIADMDKSHQNAMKASEANQRRMRESLHELRDEAQARKAENEELRIMLRETTTELHNASEKLLESDENLHNANMKIGELTADLAKYRRETPPIVQQAAKEGAKEAIKESLSSSGEIPVSVPKEPPV